MTSVRRAFRHYRDVICLKHIRPMDRVMVYGVERSTAGMCPPSQVLWEESVDEHVRALVYSS